MNFSQSRTAWLGVIALLINLIFIAVVDRTYIRHGMKGGDFMMFYTAATLLRDGNGPLIYDRALETKLEFSMIPALPPSDVPVYGQVYTHPPFELLFYLPLSFLPYKAAFFLWQILSVGLALIAARLLAEMPGKVSTLSSYVLVLGSFPFFTLLMDAQDSALLLLFVILALRAFQKNQDFAAGAFLAIGLFRYPLIVPLIALLCLRRPRILKGVISVGFASVLVSLALVKPAGCLAYARYGFEMAHASSTQISNLYQIDPRMMPTIRGLFFYCHLPTSAAIIAAVITFVACAWVICKSGSPAFQFSIAILGTLLVSPHSLMHDFVLLAIPAAFLGSVFIVPFYVAPLMVLFYPHAQAFLALPLLAEAGRRSVNTVFTAPGSRRFDWSRKWELSRWSSGCGRRS